MPPIAEIPGTLVGRFRLNQRLGGPRSGVWKAEDPDRQKQVVLRFLTRSLPSDPARRSALLERVRQRAAFHHPALPAIEAVTIEGDALVLREELIEASPLASTQKPLATEQLLKLAFQLADGLRALHARRLVHGALDPDHVLVEADGSFRFTGISLAALTAREDRGEERLLHSSDPGDLTELSFRAPEQVSARGTEIRSDVFSLGAILYEAATGRAPFGATTSTDIATAILRGSP
ncbi:MAG TPA: protein kinase, partial [Thermoanaerobaculia bacterium]|nr:protein kinase [Thermoanaerobaculia bacterium]